MDTSILTHQELHRCGSSANGCTVTERFSTDFLIDGLSLLQTLVTIDGEHTDFMGCFVRGYPEQNANAVAALLLQAPPETETGRVLLYTCPECGDIGCGAYSVSISGSNFGYMWESFAYENGYEDTRIIKGVGPFFFEKGAYEDAIRQAAAL